MSPSRVLQGVFAAAITPLLSDGSIDVEGLSAYLCFLAEQGCHGALLLGTTGEGPSFSREERAEILKAGLDVRHAYPNFSLLAGTGTPSLGETIYLTKTAFSLGYDGVVILPPYYFRNAKEDGIIAWFEQILRCAVPRDGKVFLYHIPPMSGVTLSFTFLEKLKDKYPDKFYGLKDSSGDETYCRQLGERFGKELLVFNGKDNLFPLALRNQAAGGITAGANLLASFLRQTWEAHQQGDENRVNQLGEVLQKARQVIDQFPPASALIKGLLPRFTDFPRWQPHLPLLPLAEDVLDKAYHGLIEACGNPIL
ncbi:MAG: dihydrodipicolinate synthase family protein [Anaerolineales bacterium]